MTAIAWEYSDRRILAALRFVDVFGRAPRGPVTVRANGVRYIRPRPGEIVITSAPGLEAHAASFTTPPTTPAIGSVAVPLDLWPAETALAPRRFALTLPRDPDPANAGTAGSLFQPIIVPLLPAPSATPPGFAAALRVVVTRSTDHARVEGALVRLRPSGGLPASRALTGPSGEAVLLVPSVPLSSPGSGGTVVGDVAADLDAIVDPALARFNALTDLDSARDAAMTRTGPLIDPDDLESRLSGSATSARSVRIAAGETRIPSPPEITWSPP
jgi:hypothetical protein